MYCIYITIKLLYKVYHFPLILPPKITGAAYVQSYHSKTNFALFP